MRPVETLGDRKLASVVADTAVDNIASQHVLVKAGFLETSRSREDIHYALELRRETQS